MSKKRPWGNRTAKTAELKLIADDIKNATIKNKYKVTAPLRRCLSVFYKMFLFVQL